MQGPVETSKGTGGGKRGSVEPLVTSFSDLRVPRQPGSGECPVEAGELVVSPGGRGDVGRGKASVLGGKAGWSLIKRGGRVAARGKRGVDEREPERAWNVRKREKARGVVRTNQYREDGPFFGGESSRPGLFRCGKKERGRFLALMGGMLGGLAKGGPHHVL